LYFLNKEIPTVGGLIVNHQEMPPNPIVYDLTYAREVMIGLKKERKKNIRPSTRDLLLPEEVPAI
jgi:hypothetical protein